jgi:hypothetical protein
VVVGEEGDSTWVLGGARGVCFFSFGGRTGEGWAVLQDDYGSPSLCEKRMSIHVITLGWGEKHEAQFSAKPPPGDTWALRGIPPLYTLSLAARGGTIGRAPRTIRPVHQYC